MAKTKKIIIIGAGPSGLTAAYTFARRGVPVHCFEADAMVGGISRTIERNGFRFDIGGHRFFTKIKVVNDLWNEILEDDFLLRPRVSRIYYNEKFFNYPLKAANALSGLGIPQAVRIGFSYLKSRCFPIKPEDNFEQWVTNRFGSRLYEIFFKTYTEKVWGIDCRDIRAEWASQRIKGLSLWSAAINALSIGKTDVKTLIDVFHYPKFGPGQMYETMAEKAVNSGAELYLESPVTKISHDDGRITLVTAGLKKNQIHAAGTDFISTMPITDLVQRLDPQPPEKVLKAAKSLRYRGLLTINLMLDTPQKLPDTWIYIHDPEVKMGRVQCFGNWSPFMVPDSTKSSLGLEYFCWEGDNLWEMADEDLLELGKKEITRLGLAEADSVFDGFVVRMPKCYPVYDENYTEHIKIIKAYLSGFENLQLCGRYGLFKYNNMDHSILTALYAVENILDAAGHNVWEVNADDDYHEEQS